MTWKHTELNLSGLLALIGLPAPFYWQLYLLALIPLGYAGGRLAGHLVFRRQAPPPGQA